MVDSDTVKFRAQGSLRERLERHSYPLPTICQDVSNKLVSALGPPKLSAKRIWIEFRGSSGCCSVLTPRYLVSTIERSTIDVKAKAQHPEQVRFKSQNTRCCISRKR